MKLLDVLPELLGFRRACCVWAVLVAVHDVRPFGLIADAGFLCLRELLLGVCLCGHFVSLRLTCSMRSPPLVWIMRRPL